MADYLLTAKSKEWQHKIIKMLYYGARKIYQRYRIVREVNKNKGSM